jgi:hypothetical protein
MKINHLPSQAQDEYKGKRSELENYGWAIYLGGSHQRDALWREQRGAILSTQDGLAED